MSSVTLRKPIGTTGATICLDGEPLAMLERAVHAQLVAYINGRLTGQDIYPPDADFARLWVDDLPDPKPKASVLLLDLFLGDHDEPATLHIDLEDMIEKVIRDRIDPDGTTDPADRPALSEIAATLRELSTRLEDALAGRPPASV